MNISLRQLRLFEAVARNSSFTRTAEELHLTQPAVSIQVKQMEEEVGLPLFEQIGKRIYLTDAGKAAQAMCQTVFAAMADFEMEIADRKGLKRGQLRLAVTTTAKYFIPRLLGPFCELYPGIEVSLKVTNQQSLLDRLARNADDLYVLGEAPGNMAVETLAFMRNAFVMLAHPEHPLVGQREIPPERFAEEWLLMREPGSGTRQVAERFFQAHGVAIRERMSLGSNEAIKQAVMGKLGVAILSANTVQLEHQVGQIAILDVAGLPIQRAWRLIYPADKRLSLVAQTFAAYLQKQGNDCSVDPTQRNPGGQRAGLGSEPS